MKCNTVYSLFCIKFLLLVAFKCFIIISDIKLKQTFALPNLTACHYVNFAL
jgi:hypothetical protein